jgi:hypothetical protein
MNEASPTTPAPEPDSQIAALTRAVRFGFTAIAVVFSYPNFCLASHIPAFEQIYHDMLGGKPLPSMTELVLRAHTLLLVLSVLLPLLAIGSAFACRAIRSVYLSTFFIVVVLLQLFLSWWALSRPLLSIISNLQGGQP